MKFIGVEIGGTKLQLVRGSRGVIEERRRITIPKDWGAEGIRLAIAECLPSLLGNDDRGVVGGPGVQSGAGAIGVGFGGPVDWRTGEICCSHQVEGWSEFPLGAWLAAQTKIPVFVDNDANVAALGEAAHGAGKGCDPVFFSTMGSGVGGGIVAEGRIYHGAKPGEGELGHVLLDRAGRIVESSCSGWAVDRKLREVARENSDGILAKLLGNQVGGEAKLLGEALRQGDAEAARVLRETAEDMAFALSHVAHLFHPEVIILGGGLPLLGEPLRVAVESALRKFIMEAFQPGPKVRLAALGEDAVPVGALELAARRSRE
jgi:glucokinase